MMDKCNPSNFYGADIIETGMLGSICVQTLNGKQVPSFTDVDFVSILFLKRTGDVKIISTASIPVNISTAYSTGFEKQ
jgi:hypothetical protein